MTYLNTSHSIHKPPPPPTKHIASGIQPENQNGHQQDNIVNTTYTYIYSHFQSISKISTYTNTTL